MAKYIPLSPYADVVNAMNAFLQTHHVAISQLMLREYQDSEFQRIREMNLSLPIEPDDFYQGMINVNVVNEKFASSNLTIGKELRFDNVNNPSREINGEWFKTNFFDTRERLKIQISFKQFTNENFALADVTFSSRYLVIPANPVDPLDTSVWDNAKMTREDTSPMWNDPAMVLALRKFFAYVKPIMEGWTPSETNITSQTIAQF